MFSGHLVYFLFRMVYHHYLASGLTGFLLVKPTSAELANGSDDGRGPQIS